MIRISSAVIQQFTSGIFEIHKFGNIGILVLLKIENKGEKVISDIIFNSIYP